MSPSPGRVFGNVTPNPRAKQRGDSTGPRGSNEESKFYDVSVGVGDVGVRNARNVLSPFDELPSRPFHFEQGRVEILSFSKRNADVGRIPHAIRTSVKSDNAAARERHEQKPLSNPELLLRAEGITVEAACAFHICDVHVEVIDRPSPYH